MAETSAFPRRVAFWFYALLLVAGIAFYIIWGAVYDSWNIFVPQHSGAYAVLVVLVGFGIVGMLLYRKPAAPQPPQ